jgi:DNA mismatch repair protein MutS
MLPAVQTVLRSFESPLLKELCGQLDELSDLESMIGSAISEDAPVSPRDGGIILPGYNAAVDRLRNLSAGGKDLIVAFEQSERERTGIRTLKVKFNKIFGYSIEITNAFLRQVPDNYIRKQTLTTCERFITPELQKMADDLLTADEKLRSLEYEIFSDIRRKTAENAGRIQQSARVLALLDVLCSFSQTAQKNNYVRPKINEKGVIRIRDGRHPVVERMLGEGSFVANDTLLDNEEDRIAIITGPNMAGKSTYMRMVALITLMAHMGSFVPAEAAHICLVDRIFTRIGASDDLSSGQSTFMVEMGEVANILNNATKNSLLILDEIGRGTSTYDGLSIAWAVLEFIASEETCGAKALFATHYHELSELEGRLSGVKNYRISVKEIGEDILFLRKIVRGSADKSFGVQVARLAGIPDGVITRAGQILQGLENSDMATMHEKSRIETVDNRDISVDKSRNAVDNPVDKAVLADLRALNLENMTPMMALQKLYSYHDALKEE